MIKIRIAFIMLGLALLIPFQSQSQILISLLFGDELNSENLEFGLTTGMSFSNISNIDNSINKNTIPLGLYFDIKLGKHLLLNPIVLLKSNSGAQSISPYSVGDANLDALLASADVRRNLDYINTMILLKYRFDDHFSLEAGPTIGLLTRANDDFTYAMGEENVLKYQHQIKEMYKRIDAGITFGFSYKILKGNGMSISAKYYQGMMDITKAGMNQKNSSLYLLLAVPVGKGKSE